MITTFFAVFTCDMVSLCRDADVPGDSVHPPPRVARKQTDGGHVGPASLNSAQRGSHMLHPGDGGKERMACISGCLVSYQTMEIFALSYLFEKYFL